MQGIGWALNEEYIYDAAGRLENAGFLDYRIPVASDLPMIETVLVEVPNPNHPFGVKGVGEVNIVPPMAAVANAINHAIGRRLTELPMSPPKVLAAIDAREQAYGDIFGALAGSQAVPQILEIQRRPGLAAIDVGGLGRGLFTQIRHVS